MYITSLIQEFEREGGICIPGNPDNQGYECKDIIINDDVPIKVDIVQEI